MIEEKNSSIFNCLLTIPPIQSNVVKTSCDLWLKIWKVPVLLSFFDKSLYCCLSLLLTSLFQRYHTAALKWCWVLQKLIARVPNGRFSKRCYMEWLVDITRTGFQRKFKILTSSSPSGNVASLRSLLGNRCITFPFTSSKIQWRKASLIRNSEISRGVWCLHNSFLCKTGS